MKTLRLVTAFPVLMLLLLGTAYAQSPWSQRATMPGLARHRAFTFTIGQRGYFGCGWNGVTMYSDVWEYDPGTDSWMQKASYPGGPRLSPFGFAIGNMGYVGTGLDAGLSSQSDCYKYNPATNQWTPIAPFIGTPVFAASAAVVNNTGYVFFGDDWDIAYWKHNEVYEYNPTLNAWSYVSAFLGDGRRDQVCFAIGNKIYIGTGNDNNYTELADWWQFDPSNYSWTAKAPFIGSPRSQAVGFAVNGKGYMGTGGQDDDKYFFEYNPVTNSWQGINDFDGSGRENSMSFVIGTKAYVVAGTSGINYHDCWEFDPNLVTGVEESNNETVDISVYPNPAADRINIDLHTDARECNYQIYDVSGHLVSEANSPVVSGSVQIPVNQLANGQYTVVVRAQAQAWKARFVH